MWIVGSATISGCTISNSTAGRVRQHRRTWRSAYPRAQHSRRDTLATCLQTVLLVIRWTRISLPPLNYHLLPLTGCLRLAAGCSLCTAGPMRWLTSLLPLSMCHEPPAIIWQ